MKASLISNPAIVAIFYIFLPSSVYAAPIPYSETNPEGLNEQTFQSENFRDQSWLEKELEAELENELENELEKELEKELEAKLEKGKLRADLARGLYDSVLNKIAATYPKEVLDSEVLSIKIAAFIGIKDFTSARKAISNFNKDKSISEEAILLIGAMYLKAGKPLDALKVCQKGLAANIKSPKLLFMTGRIYDSIGQSNTALIYYERSAELNKLKKAIPTRALNESIANSYLKSKKLTEAKNVFTNEEDIQSESLVKKIAFAKYYASRREFNKSLDLLDAVIATNRAHAPVILKAQVLNLAGKPEMAIEYLTSLKQQTEPSFPLVSMELTKSLSYLLTNSPQKSLAALNRMNFSKKRPPDIELVLAVIHLSLGDAQSATQALKRAPVPFSEIADLSALQDSLKSPSLGPAIGLAYFCLDQGYYQQAVEIVKDGLAKNPDNVFLHLILAETYRQTGKYDLALAEFKRLKTIMPESFSIRYLLAKTYEEAGMDQQALQNYASLSKDRPDFLLAQLAYGKLLERLGEWDKARNAYEWSLNFKPDSVPLLISLGWTLSHLKDLEALEPVLRALKANEKTGHSSILHLEGWAAYQRNDPSRAVELLTQALAEAPGNPELCYHLGMAYVATGDKQQAENLLQQAFLFPEQAGKYKN